MWTPKQSPNSARPHRPHRPHAHLVAPTVGAAALTLGMAARHAGHGGHGSSLGNRWWNPVPVVWLKKWLDQSNKIGIYYCDSCDILWLYWGFHSGYKTWRSNQWFECDWIWFWYIWFTVNKQDWDITGAIRNIICKWWILCSYVDLLGGTQGLINRRFLNRGGIDKCW
jgi:hypothetical protein